LTRSLRFITSPAGAVAKYCDQHVCLCVCSFVRKDISGTTRAYVRGSVFLWPVDDRPHRLSAGRGWRECTVRAKHNLGLPCYYYLNVFVHLCPQTAIHLSTNPAWRRVT